MLTLKEGEVRSTGVFVGWVQASAAAGAVAFVASGSLTVGIFAFVAGCLFGFYASKHKRIRKWPRGANP